MRRLLPAALILLLSFAAYAPSLQFKYVQDAYFAVKTNPVVERGDVVEIFTSDYWKDTQSLARTLYRPVTVLSFAAERLVAADSDPRVSHLVNILLHALTAYLLWLLARRSGAGEFAAAVAAGVFAAHPLCLQAVVNVVGRADQLATMFSLAAVLTYSYAGRWPWGSKPGPVRRRVAAWGTGVFVFAASGSKEIGLAVIPLLVVCEVLYRLPARPRERSWWLGRAGSLGPCVLAVLLYLHLRTVAVGEFPGLQPLAAEDNVLVGLGGIPRVATTLAMLARYLGLLFWPRGLSPDYSGPVIERESSLVGLLPVAGLVALLFLLALALGPLLSPAIRRGQGSPRLRSTALGAWLFLLPYLLIGNVFVLNAAGFAERLVYFSATGFCLLGGLALDGVISWSASASRSWIRRAATGLVLLAIVAGVVQIRHVSPMWADSEAMYDRALLVTPKSLRANLAMAGKLEARGSFDEARAVYERINEFYPDYGGAWMARGLLLARAGELDAAEQALRRAVDARAGVGEVHMNLGLVLVQQGDRAAAERELRRALLLNPALVKAAAQLGHLLFQSQRYAEAAHFYRGCVELGREDLRGHLREARARARVAASPR